MPGSARAAELAAVMEGSVPVAGADGALSAGASPGVRNTPEDVERVRAAAAEWFPAEEQREIVAYAPRLARLDRYPADWIIQALEECAELPEPIWSSRPVGNKLRDWAAAGRLPARRPVAEPATLPFRKPAETPLPPEYVPDPEYAAKLRREREEREARTAARAAAALDKLPARLKQYVPRRALP